MSEQQSLLATATDVQAEDPYQDENSSPLTRFAKLKKACLESTAGQKIQAISEHVDENVEKMFGFRLSIQKIGIVAFFIATVLTFRLAADAALPTQLDAVRAPLIFECIVASLAVVWLVVGLTLLAIVSQEREGEYQEEYRDVRRTVFCMVMCSLAKLVAWVWLTHDLFQSDFSHVHGQNNATTLPPPHVNLSAAAAWSKWLPPAATDLSSSSQSLDDSEKSRLNAMAAVYTVGAVGVSALFLLLTAQVLVFRGHGSRWPRAPYFLVGSLIILAVVVDRVSIDHSADSYRLGYHYFMVTSRHSDGSARVVLTTMAAALNFMSWFALAIVLYHDETVDDERIYTIFRGIAWLTLALEMPSTLFSIAQQQLRHKTDTDCTTYSLALVIGIALPDLKGILLGIWMWVAARELFAEKMPRFSPINWKTAMLLRKYVIILLLPASAGLMIMCYREVKLYESIAEREGHSFRLYFLGAAPLVAAGMLNLVVYSSKKHDSSKASSWRRDTSSRFS